MYTCSDITQLLDALSHGERCEVDLLVYTLMTVAQGDCVVSLASAVNGGEFHANFWTEDDRYFARMLLN